eukprot:COSAG03_NODE_818_length_5740_cov_266.943272_3_plen_72_part_00
MTIMTEYAFLCYSGIFRQSLFVNIPDWYDSCVCVCVCVYVCVCVCVSCGIVRQASSVHACVRAGNHSSRST